MQIRVVKGFSERKKADALLIPCWADGDQARLAVEVPQLNHILEHPIRLGDFKGKEGEVHLIYLSELPEPRAILVGLGEEKEVTAQALRLGYGAAAKRCCQVRAKAVNLFLPPVNGGDEILRGAAEGLLVANYAFNQLKSDQSVSLIEKVTCIKGDARRFTFTQTLTEAVSFARDLVNANADDLPPPELASRARELAKSSPALKVTVLDKRRIEKEGMGLLLAVNRGSSHDPAFIMVEYRGNPKSDDHTVIVGKGVTYDTGGLRLKPASGMETMKTDMAAGAACLGTMHALANLKLPVNVTAVVPSAENCIGSRAFKIGDVYRSYSGKMVEVVDTDAEGRLILADALAYAIDKFQPSRIIDLATLTGSVVIALGEEVAGVMASDSELSQAIVAAGEACGESCWPLPLPKSYRKLLKSEIGDFKNVGTRAGGAITAALFLKEFVGETPWAHLDIAGTGYPDKPISFNPVRATGFGVRLLTEFFIGLTP